MNTEHVEALRAANEADLYAWRDFLDLRVQLAVELGRTNLTARAILELEQNSIIKLGRSTGEGVDLLADNLPLARGEIIMLEDRTGVRLKEILAEERR